MLRAKGGLWLLSIVALCSGGQAAAADSDKSQLKTADVNSLFPGGARTQPLPLPLGPAYNSSDFKAYVNVTLQMYTDQPASGFAVNQSFLSLLVNQLGQLYYPQGVLFEVLDLVAANANDSMVDCTIPMAGGNWGICASMLMMLQDDTKATFVKSTLVNVDVANGQGVPSGAANLASALSRTAATYGAGLMWEAVPQADLLQPPLLQPVYSFWSPIPTRTRTMTAQLQGNQILPFAGYQHEAALGAIKKSLANVATYVALDGITPSNQAAGRKLMASRTTPYVNITFDFDCFASLSLPTTLSDWQVLSPELLKNLQAAGVPVEVVQVVAVNFTTPADLVAAQAAAAINAPPSPTDADRAILNSVAAATNLTKALTDSMSQTLNALGYSPGAAGGAGASPQAPGQAAAASFPKASPPPYGPASPLAQAPGQTAAAGAPTTGASAAPGSPAEQALSPPPPAPDGSIYKLFANAPGHGRFVPLIAGLLGGLFAVLVAACITAAILFQRRRRRRKQAELEGVKQALHSEPGADEDPYHALMLSNPTTGPNTDKNAINSLGGGGDSMAYVSLGSRSRPLASVGGGSGSRGGSGGGLGSGTGTAFSSGALGTSMMGMARSTSTALSDSMKPPPGYTPAASVIAPQDLTICKKSDGSDFLLGQGTFGAVYKAMRRHVQECAVKILRNVNEDELTNFQREVYIMQQCSFDRNIVQFYGFCTSPPMLVLEFMEGGDMWSALRGPHREELQWYGRGRSLALDIARGLHFLHEHKVVHADMKTKNILLSAGRMTAKIADVGLARYMAQTHMDTKSLPMGTFVYAAPELLLGRRSDHKVDIYSVGIILWELVTLMTPARGNLRSVKVPEECPADVAHLIEDCLNANNPDERPTASQIYDRLISSAATVEEAHDRMLHPERYEKTEATLTLTPSGDTEFNTAQPAGSTAASLTDADMEGAGEVAPVQADELWDDSFKPPGTLQRSNSPTSTLADRFASAGSWSGTEPGNCDSFEAGSGAPDSEYGTPDTHERQAMLAESTDCLGKSASTASRNSFDSDDASSSSPAVGPAPAAQSLGSSTAPAPAKQLAPGPSLDVIREDEEHGHRHPSPKHSLHKLEEGDEGDGEDQHELEPLTGREESRSDGEEGESNYDDDAASEASSEALALAVATEEAVKEEEEAAQLPSQPRQGLTRLGSLLPRRAEAVQEGEPRLPGAASLSKSLGRLSSMLPRRRSDNAGQDASDDDCEDDAAFASKPPLAKTRSISKGWNRVGALLPVVISNRSSASTVADPSSEGDSLRASFNRQAPKSNAALPTRVSLEEQRLQEEPARSATPGQSARLPRRPSMPSTPTAQPALRPTYASSSKPASSSGAPSLAHLSDVSGSSPAPQRAHFSPATSTSGDEQSPSPAQRLRSGQSGYAASKELSADEAPARIPNRPARPAQRPQPRQALRGKGSSPAATPEVAFVPSVTIKKDVAQTLGANFWASAAGASYGSQRGATPPVTELPHPQPGPELHVQGAAGMPGARALPAVAAAANFWEAATAGQPLHEETSRDAGRPGKATGTCEADKQPAMPASPAGHVELKPPAPMHAPTPSQKLAANNFWQQAAERTFSDDAKPEESEPPTHAAAPTDDRSPPRAVGPQCMSSQPAGAPAASGKRASARHLAARLRQQAAVRQSSLAAVMSGSVPLKEAASIRDTALRAMDGTGENSPTETPNGKALWMRAKSIAVSGPEQDAAAASRSRSVNPGLVSTRTKDLWMRGRVGGSPTSEDDSLQGASMQAQDSSSTLSVLISDGSRQLSNLSSPFVSVLPGARNAAVDKSDAERADEDLAQQLFRAAQARQKRRSTR